MVQETTTYVELPNGKIAKVVNGTIRVSVCVDLSDLLQRNLDEFLGYISELAVGTQELTDIGYTVSESHGTGLTLTVEGSLEHVECEPVALESLPIVEFEVNVTRCGYGCEKFKVQARTEEDARELALDQAGDHYYCEHGSEYQAEVARRVSEQVVAHRRTGGMG